MKTLDAHGDDYRNAQLTILLEVGLGDNANEENFNCNHNYNSVSMLFYISKMEFNCRTNKEIMTLF